MREYSRLFCKFFSHFSSFRVREERKFGFFHLDKITLKMNTKNARIQNEGGGAKNVLETLYHSVVYNFFLYRLTKSFVFDNEYYFNFWQPFFYKKKKEGFKFCIAFTFW